jgi:hypothetical protein
LAAAVAVALWSRALLNLNLIYRVSFVAAAAKRRSAFSSQLNFRGLLSAETWDSVCILLAHLVNGEIGTQKAAILNSIGTNDDIGNGYGNPHVLLAPFGMYSLAQVAVFGVNIC